MKDSNRLVFILVLTTSAVMAQAGNQNLAIEPDKPYVYIQLDHLGDRKPIDENEISCGLWLRLSNNSRIPIGVRTFDPGTKDPGVGLMHEVVRVLTPVGFETPSNSGLHKATAPPIGYELDVGSRSVIPSGRHLLFGVPANHVSPNWYIRVRFEFEVPQPRSGHQPYSLVEFGWLDLPPGIRSSIKTMSGGKCPQP